MCLILFAHKMHSAYRLVVGANRTWMGVTRSGKTERGKRGLEQLLAAPVRPAPEAIPALLADETIPGNQELPDTGIGREHERILTPAFINGPLYGSRASTVLLIAHDGEVTFVERTFGPVGERRDKADHHFRIG